MKPLNLNNPIERAMYMNDHDVLINAVELATQLSDQELRANWDYRLGDIDVDDDDEVGYTEDAQDIFDALYDKYYALILSCKS